MSQVLIVFGALTALNIGIVYFGSEYFESRRDLPESEVEIEEVQPKQSPAENQQAVERASDDQ